MDNNQNAQNQGVSGQQLQVKVSDEILKGVYANMLQVAHNKEEFFLDFMNIFPPAGVLSSRVIVSPSHFKRIVAACEQNLKQYEDQFGKVEEGQEPSHQFGFKTE